MSEIETIDVLERLRSGALRRDFPIFKPENGGRDLVYLDSGASAQTPQRVIDAIDGFYSNDYANIHRGVYPLSERATRLYEGARRTVSRFLGARAPEEIVLLRGATEALNLLAFSFARPRLDPGDEILITAMEHHANIVPWQMVCEQTGAKLTVAPIDDWGVLDTDAFRALIGPRTRLISMAHVSNVLGTVNPVKALIASARERGIPVILDGAQAVPHAPVDVSDLDCDFYVFSGHKLYGPTGIGALYGKSEHLEAMPPWQGGGDMIRRVSFESTEYAPPPSRFEAGTPNIAGAIGLAAAIDYVQGIGFDAIAADEAELAAYGKTALESIPGLRMIGDAPDKAAVFSFVMDGIHPHDIASFLAGDGIAVRAGHHCAQPLMDRFGVPATIRASLGLYNTRSDLDALAVALGGIRSFFDA